MSERGVLNRFTVVTKALGLIALVAVALTLVVGWWLQKYFPPPADHASRILYLEQYVAVIQVIAVGIVVALISVIVPLVLPEARDRFEQYKESRRAYSRAKTAVIYLPDRVSSADKETAVVLVEGAHRELHLAETFEDVIIEKGYLKWFERPDLWIPYNYWQIVAVAEVLRKGNQRSPEDTDALTNRLRDTLNVVHKYFGKRGENCKDKKWERRDGSRYKEEDWLENEINRVLDMPRRS
jgi:hypothetical protein